MNPRSLAKTLPGERAIRHGVLHGYRRKANINFDGYAYLNIVPDQDSDVSGVLIPIEKAELSAFAQREEGYDVVDLTAGIDPVGTTVVAFIAPDVPCTKKIPRSYLLTCTTEMSDEERARWITDTEVAGIEEDLDKPVYEFVAE